MSEDKSKKKKSGARRKESLELKKDKRSKKEETSSLTEVTTINENEDVKVDSKKNVFSKYTFNLIEVIIIMVITVIFGLLLGGIIAYTKPNSVGKCEGSSTSIRKEVSLFAGVYDDILSEYYGEITKEDLLEAAIEGMVTRLNDPYASYLNVQEANTFEEELKGSFVGIGVEVSFLDGSLPTVLDVFANSPSYRAGILSGDIISKIDGKDVSGLTLDEISTMVKSGEKDSKVLLTILRNDQTLEIEVVRDVVEIPSVNFYTSLQGEENIGVIVISTFATNTTNQFQKAYEELKKVGVTSLVIDVRNNSGGYLSVAKEIASLFLEEGSVIYQKGTKEEMEKFVSSNEKKIDLPVVVVTNHGTASASEVLTAALSENLGVEIVGEKTYGKGTIQKLHELSNGSFVKYTVQKWFTPSGDNVEGVGISPTVEVSLSDEYYQNPTLELDLQIQKAFELLRK